MHVIIMYDTHTTRTRTVRDLRVNSRRPIENRMDAK